MIVLPNCKYNISISVALSLQIDYCKVEISVCRSVMLYIKLHQRRKKDILKLLLTSPCSVQNINFTIGEASLNDSSNLPNMC